MENKKFKVVITDHEYKTIDNEISVLEEIAEVYDYQYKDIDNIVNVAKDADALIIQYAKMPKELIDQLDKCKIIARYATGFDGIDLEVAGQKGIYVTNVPDYCRDEVATHALALLLELNRNVRGYNSWTHAGNWFSMPNIVPSLKESIIGVISFGRIAKAFIDKVKPLCDNIWVFDEYVSDEEIINYGVVPKNFEELLEGSDYISVHCPLTPETKHLFNKETFKKMKNTACLINVARGGVLSEKDLLWAIENHEIGGAALDVLEIEPPDANNPLFKCDNVIITPHTAWYSEKSQKTLQTTPAEEIKRVLTGHDPLYPVNVQFMKK